jgi:hypothetical protein
MSYTQIERKLAELKKTPFDGLTKEKAEKLDLFDFAYTDLKLSGSKLTPEGVLSIIDGVMVTKATIAEHQLVERHLETIKLFRKMSHMQISMDSKSLADIYKALSGESEASYRRITPSLIEYDYTPPFHDEIESRLTKLFTQTTVAEVGVIKNAANIHDGIIGIYPYEKGSDMLARAALQYILFSHGLPIIRLNLSEHNYNTLIADTLNKGGEGIHPYIVSGIENKLDSLLDLYI